MGRAILALFVTLVVGLLTMSIFTGAAEVGIVVAIAVMGAFVIYFNEKNKQNYSLTYIKISKKD